MIDDLLELQRAFGGPGFIGRLSIQVVEDPGMPAGRVLYLRDLGRLLVPSIAELQWQLHLIELDHAVRRIYDDALVRLARFAGVPYDRTLLRASQRPRRSAHEHGRAYDRVDGAGRLVHVPL